MPQHHTAWSALLRHRATKPLVFAAALAPALALVAGALLDRLGANPAEALSRGTGDWTLRLLAATLAVTPLREVLGEPALARFRRMLGLFAFFYATLHLAAYAWFDMGLDLADIGRDIAKRPFVLAGMAAFVPLLALAATSPAAAVRRLGARRWQALHRSVYGVALLALLHFYWMRAGKNDFATWSVYAAIFAVLLGWRLVRAIRRRLDRS